jgi:uncharacterized protein YbjQ (UPF0145 family)
MALMSPDHPSWQSAGYPLPVTTAFDFPDFDLVTTIGAVSGVYATSLGIGRSFTAGFSALARGEVGQMTELLTEARHTALARTVDAVGRVGGNALIGVRFDSNEVNGQIIEIHCYGTAVIVRGKGS